MVINHLHGMILQVGSSLENITQDSVISETQDYEKESVKVCCVYVCP